ncbi:MAG: GNAT family N-acetyltransferase [Acinetobacter populi]|nr:GNAT family N-acetyltransferase [Acinetobacter populi]
MHIDYQNQGVGKMMLAAAEQFIRENLSVQYIEMSVLSTRQELIVFYQRRGYQLDGQVQAYPTDAGVGIPRVDNLQVLTMCKNLVS